MFQKEGANELLTCALMHDNYSGMSIYGHFDYVIRLAKDDLTRETDPEKIKLLNYGIDARKLSLSYMKRHTDKYPVADPSKTCPKRSRLE